MGRLAHLLIAGCFAAAAHAGAEPQARVSELLGKQVHGPQAEHLGEISGLLLDSRRAGVHYVLLATAQGKRFAYPVNALRRDAGGLLRLDVPARNLAALPGFDGNRWPDPQHRSAARYARASRVLGSAAEDPLGNRLGTLADIVVSLETGHTRYVLVDFDGDNEATLPLPPHSVRLRPGANPVVHGDPQRRS